MQFLRSSGPEAGRLKVAQDLRNELELGHKVLWLISGGSNIKSCRQILTDIPSEYPGTLTVMLNDERYGPIGHKDSNWHKFVADSDEEGKFPETDAKLEAVLRPGLSFDENADYYESIAREAFQQNDIIISLLGMGEDGHTAGILPNSAAAQETKRMAVGYKGTDGYLRLTLSFSALRQVTRAYLFAFGEGKKPALENLHDSKLSLEDQPAQILWEIPEVYVYNDQIGDAS
jgi:6-phosphogluconolactonase/glucosamine-6-phosphate isomerase/deaminase